MRRKFLSLLLAATLFAGVILPARTVLASTDPSPLGLSLDGQTLVLAKPILNVDGRSLLPMRAFFETLGATVVWDEAEQTATATKGSHTLVFTIGVHTLWADGKATTLDVPAQLIEGSTYVPVRAAAEGLGYEVDWSPTTGIALKANPNTAATIISASRYDQAWYSSDRQHFGDLLKQAIQDRKVPGPTLYAEWRMLGKQMQQVNEAAIRSKRGYTLYSPDQTQDLNILTLALEARTALLTDLAENHPLTSLAEYYPNYSFPLVDADLNATPGGSVGISTNDAEQEIDSLPMPDAVLYGLRIYLTPAKSTEASGYNWEKIMPGHFGGKIIIFGGWDGTFTHQVIAHEVGHSLGKEIFQNAAHDLFAVGDNQQALADYGKLYGKTITAYEQGSWGEEAAENFADDYAHLVTGYEKLADWPSPPNDQLKAFIDAHSTNVKLPTDEMPTMRGLTLGLDGVEMPLLDIADKPPASEQTYVSRSGYVQVRAEGYLPGPRPMQVWVGDKAFPFDANGIANVTLPTAGQTYTLQFGTWSDGGRSRWLVYGSIPVLYSPY